jgi:uncharacterized membrane protein (DUF4010 family)
MPPLLESLVLSGCLGALIGTIRQWSEQHEAPAGADDFGGARTYTLWALLGAVAAYASREYTPLALPLVILVLGAQQVMVRAGSRSIGSTRFAAFLITLLVGALVAWEQRQAAALLAAATVVILASKQPVHEWTRHFTPQDIRATVQFVAITGVILPLVPNRAFGPFEGFNPYHTWLMVVLISGIGFTGYVAMRLLGANAGILLTSVLGGVASSTATTLAFSRRSREEPSLEIHYAFAVLVACTVMLPRIILAVAVVDRALVTPLILPFTIMAAPAVGYGIWWWLSRHRRAEAVATPAISNPLSLATAVKFGLLYAAVAFLLKTVTALDWNAGVLPLSFLSGLTDVDAISLSVARGSADAVLEPSVAVRAILIAAAANSLMKAVLAVSLGSGSLRLHVGATLGLTAVLGGAAAWLTV